MTRSISTHVLDTSRGKPAQGVPVILAVRLEDGAFTNLGRGYTDADGRLRELLPPGSPLAAGVYRLQFGVEAYFKTLGQETFYPEAQIIFQVRDVEQHYHVPLLLSPWGYATYRGS